MDRIFSARIDDRVYKKISDLSLKLHTSKKAIIEKAIELLGNSYQEKEGTSIFDETSGVWQRKENVKKTISNVRTVFSQSMEKHK